jgi:hypothetical protein
MNYARLKIWSIVTLTLAVMAIVIRAIWQIVVIPTGGTMLTFIPLILALLFAEFLAIYLVRRPKRLKNLPFTIGITIAFSAGLVAGVTHFVRFIISDIADPFWSKVISALVLAASLSAYSLILYAVWSFRRAK